MYIISGSVDLYCIVYVYYCTLCTVGWHPPDCPPGIIEMYHVYVDGFLKTTVRASDKTRALVEGVDSAKVGIIDFSGTILWASDKTSALVEGEDSAKVGICLDKICLCRPLLTSKGNA